MKIQKERKTPKVMLIVILVVAFILAGGAAYWYMDTNGFFKQSGNGIDKQDGNDTQIDKNNDGTTDGDDEKGTDEKPSVEIDDSGKKIAQVVVVDAGEYDTGILEVRAGVTNLTEENGKCEFTFTHNKLSVVRSSNAIFTGTGVDCQTLEIPFKDFPVKGEWQMVVKYTSNTAVGSSQTKMVMIK